MQKIRGSKAAFVFQDPMTTLNPTIPVGKQITEALLHHKKLSESAAKARAIELMEQMGIRDAEHMYGLQPQFFSGGMRQRCVLAIAMAMEPKVIFADEAITALDVTVASKILDVLLEIREKTGTSIVFVSHDLGAVARIADRVAVMYAGKIVEVGTAREVFYDPRHPYTWGLLASNPALCKKGQPLYSIPGMPPSLLNPPKGDAFATRNEFALAIDYEQMPPMTKISETHFAATWLLDESAPKVERPSIGRIDGAANVKSEANAKRSGMDLPEKIVNENVGGIWSQAPRSDSDLCLHVEHLKQYFRISKKMTVKAVDDISFDIRKGEVFALVGETGCGKSTAARTIAGIYKATEGSVHFNGHEISSKKQSAGGDLQMIFQDSAAALNPRMTVEKLILEPWKIKGLDKLKGKEETKKRLLQLIKDVGLDETYLGKYPSELSGGQRQRVAIARSLMPDPKLVIADEPIASLDISIQAQIINLFRKLQQEYHFTFLFIAHDLSVVRYLSNRIGVMLQGKLVEVAETEELFDNPRHPYTQSLLSAIHLPDPDREREHKLIEYDTSTTIDGMMVEVQTGHYVLQNAAEKTECMMEADACIA